MFIFRNNCICGTLGRQLENLTKAVAEISLKLDALHVEVARKDICEGFEPAKNMQELTEVLQNVSFVSQNLQF